MIEKFISLLRGETLIVKSNEKTIIEVSFYDKQHGIISDYPCINTCIMYNTGEEWFTTTYFSWSEFIQELNAYISHYEVEIQNTDNIGNGV